MASNPIQLKLKASVVFASHCYFVADHQTGETAHYSTAAQALAAGRTLAQLKVHALGLNGLLERRSQDGVLYFAAAACTDMDRQSFVAVGKAN